MKQMQRDPLASSRARKAEQRADEKSGLITIKPFKADGSGGASVGAKPGGGGFKKGGFKSAFGGADVRMEAEPSDGPPGGASAGPKEEVESDTDDEYEHYDPRRPTGCPDNCPGYLP